MKEAVGWSIFYIALPLIFGVWVWNAHGRDIGVKYYTGYLVEKSLSVDNLFVFIVIIGSFAVPRALQQRVLLVGVVGALVLRGIFIVRWRHPHREVRGNVPGIWRDSASSRRSRCTATRAAMRTRTSIVDQTGRGARSSAASGP